MNYKKGDNIVFQDFNDDNEVKTGVIVDSYIDYSKNEFYYKVRVGSKESVYMDYFWHDNSEYTVISSNNVLAIQEEEPYDKQIEKLKNSLEEEHETNRKLYEENGELISKYQTLVNVCITTAIISVILIIIYSLKFFL